jgi:hypothetical protein
MLDHGRRRLDRSGSRWQPDPLRCGRAVQC